MNIQRLTDPEKIPDEKYLKTIISKPLFETYKGIQSIFQQAGLIGQWRYYNDGKAWLCKITHGTKTIAWLSLWEHYFQTSFFFTEKSRGGVMELAIHQTVLSSFQQAKPIGKLIPLLLQISTDDALDDFKKIVLYKKSLK